MTGPEHLPLRVAAERLHVPEATLRRLLAFHQRVRAGVTIVEAPGATSPKPVPGQAVRP